MNDFLQSLRNGQAEKQRIPKTRKNIDNSYQYSSPSRFHSYSGYPNTRNQNMKRPPVPHQPGNQLPMDEPPTTTMLAEAIENLTGHIETLVKNQDYMISINERTADMLERQAIAIERIVDYLDIAPEPQTALQTGMSPVKTFENHYVTSRDPEPLIAEPAETPAEAAAGCAEPSKPILRKRKKVAAKKAELSVSADSNLLSREAVMDIINNMRAEGATFDQVASHLIELGQPTFSGRGEWHAQTIHRLCNKK